jgi:hypothetical protein
MKKYIIFILSLVLLSSCTNDSPRAYSVENELDVYAQRFFNYAKNYGYNFDNEGLVMRFATLKDNKGGVCYINRRPIQIEIDSAYWKELSKSYLADEHKEQLVFHEMGHGFLQRLHINDILQNKDWKSIMCGDELPEGRASNINYRGMRQSYYINELFTQTTEVPSWSTFVPDFSGMFQHLYFQHDINNPKFPTVKQDNFYGRVENGVYIATSYSSNITANIANLVNTLEDFCLEAVIKIQANDANKDAFAGIYFGEADSQKENTNLHYISLDSKQHIFIGENRCLIPFIDLYRTEYKLGDYNKIKIYKQGQFIYYFINDTFIYHNDISDLIQGGECAGLLIYAGNTVYVKDFKVYLDRPAQRSYKEMVPQIFEIEKPFIEKKEY